jgi:hypothetical protein
VPGCSRIVTFIVLMLAPLLLLADGPEAVLQGYLEHIAASLPEQAAGALKEIEGAPRQLLATRAYLRAGDKLLDRWSWSAEQIKKHTQSAEYRALLAETYEVRRRFEEQNPGYTLYANTEARSLELQISRYNSNKSVGRAADALYKQALAELAKPGYASEPGLPVAAESLERFKKFLTRWRPSTAAALASPGISRHGQLRAIDFQIMQNGAVVAPPETGTVQRNWDAPGWTEKLRAAAAGSKFRGPLQSPYEPWHYEYDP